MTEREHDGIDVSPLDPTRDARAFDGVVAGIVEAGAFELARRRAAASPLTQIGRWRRPMWAAAAVVAAVSLAVLARVETRAAPSGDAAGIAEALGVPGDLATWLRADEMPPAADLLFAWTDTR